MSAPPSDQTATAQSWCQKIAVRLMHEIFQRHSLTLHAIVHSSRQEVASRTAKQPHATKIRASTSPLLSALQAGGRGERTISISPVVVDINDIRPPHPALGAPKIAELPCVGAEPPQVVRH